MRVIAGSARGLPLQSVVGTQTRPTTDRVKESLFNILSPHIAGSRFLDLFAGNGGIGIEALSRGAMRAIFIDKSSRCSAMIKQNLQTAKLEGEVYKNDVGRALPILRKREQQFELIFLDPPYGRNLIIPTLQSITENNLVTKHGIIIAEYGKKEEIPIAMWNLTQVRIEKYGDTNLAFYRHEEDLSEN